MVGSRVNFWRCSFSRFGKCWKYYAGNIWCSRAVNRNETHVNHHFALMMGSQKWTENEEQFNFGIQQLLFPHSYERMWANPLQKAAMRQIRQSNMRRKGQEIYFLHGRQIHEQKCSQKVIRGLSLSWLKSLKQGVLVWNLNEFICGCKGAINA